MDFGLTLDLGIILAIAALIFELRNQRNSDRELARREQRRSQVEIYQRLELASIELYRFEADHLDVIRPLYTGVGAPTETAALHAYQNYVTQILILFELQIELYCNELVEAKILKTWLPWLNEVGLAPGFAAVWSGGYDENYSDKLRAVMEKIRHSGQGITMAELIEALKD